MTEKLEMGDQFPSMSVSLVGGGEIDLPGAMGGNYNVVLFYRGHWWPYCRRQLVDFEKYAEELKALDVKVFAASVDTEDKAQEVEDEVSFPIGYAAGTEHRDLMGSWWEDRRSIIQPSEFLLNGEGKVMASSYSSGPIGRFDPQDVIKMVNFLESMKNK
jgi:peroxiredoxin